MAKIGVDRSRFRSTRHVEHVLPLLEEEEEMINGETFLLQARGKSLKEDDVIVFVLPIRQGDALHKIAVEYCCEIADLKRLNSLMNEQDFYALKTIKVPVKRHSTLHEKLEREINALGAGGEGGSADAVSRVEETDLDGQWADSDDDDSENQVLIRTINIKHQMCSQSDEARSFLHKMDLDIKNILTSTKSSKKRSLEEVRSSLTCRRIFPLRRQNSFLGADCGIKIGTIISVILIVAIATPLVFFLYYKYHLTGPDDR